MVKTSLKQPMQKLDHAKPKRRVRHSTAISERVRLSFLTVSQVHQIDQALVEAGKYGEVILVKRRNQLQGMSTAETGASEPDGG